MLDIVDEIEKFAINNDCDDVVVLIIPDYIKGMTFKGRHIKVKTDGLLVEYRSSLVKIVEPFSWILIIENGFITDVYVKQSVDKIDDIIEAMKKYLDEVK